MLAHHLQSAVCRLQQVSVSRVQRAVIETRRSPADSRDAAQVRHQEAHNQQELNAIERYFNDGILVANI